MQHNPKCAAVSKKEITLNSLFGISLNAACCHSRSHRGDHHHTSQFPFWDFVECSRQHEREHIPLGLRALNSLFGISLNAALRARRLYRRLGYDNSQFPFWDFVECSMGNLNQMMMTEMMNSQFPFWDFVECSMTS